MISMEKGRLIVVEGSVDGIGKSTQFKRLYEHLVEDGYSVVTHHFPTYNSTQGALVEEYLRGEYGKPKDESPYFINGLFAIDRAVTWRKDLKKPYEEGSIILLDRYTTSSQLYQSVPIEDIDDKKKFIDYINDFEYSKLRIQKPDMVIFLTAPYDVVADLRRKRKENDGIANDIHESDESYLRKVYDNSSFIADYLSWDVVDCCNENSEMDSIENIHNKIYSLVKRM